MEAIVKEIGSLVLCLARKEYRRLRREHNTEEGIFVRKELREEGHDLMKQILDLVRALDRLKHEGVPNVDEKVGGTD